MKTAYSSIKSYTSVNAVYYTAAAAAAAAAAEWQIIQWTCMTYPQPSFHTVCRFNNYTNTHREYIMYHNSSLVLAEVMLERRMNARCTDVAWRHQYGELNTAMCSGWRRPPSQATSENVDVFRWFTGQTDDIKYSCRINVGTRHVHDGCGGRVSHRKAKAHGGLRAAINGVR